MEDVKVVINFDYPQSSEDYIHRIGRTGRLQQSGTSYAFFTQSNIRHASELISVLRETNQVVSPQLLELAEIAKSDMGGKNKFKGQKASKPQNNFQRGVNKPPVRNVNVRNGGNNNNTVRNGNRKFENKPNFTANRFPQQRNQNRINNQRNVQNQTKQFGNQNYQRNDYGNQGFNNSGYNYPPPSQGYSQAPPNMGQFNVPPPGYGANGTPCVQYPMAY